MSSTRFPFVVGTAVTTAVLFCGINTSLPPYSLRPVPSGEGQISIDHGIASSLDRYTQIRRIVNKDKITRGDKLKIKIICEIVFDEFKQLNHTILTRKDLIKRAEEQNNNYKELYEDVKNKL